MHLSWQEQVDLHLARRYYWIIFCLIYVLIREFNRLTFLTSYWKKANVHDTDEFITMNKNNHMYVYLVSFKHVIVDFIFYWIKTFLAISIIAICYRNLFDLFSFKTVLYQINEGNWKIVVTVTMNTVYIYKVNHKCTSIFHGMNL